MSVRKNERSENPLQVLNDARILTEYTIKTCKNEKNFPKSTRWIMANRIVNECLDAYVDLRKANSVPLDEENAKWRKRLQDEAYTHLYAMEGLIDLSINTFNLDMSKAEHWTSLVENTSHRMKAWQKSDKERIKKKS